MKVKFQSKFLQIIHLIDMILIEILTTHFALINIVSRVISNTATDNVNDNRLGHRNHSDLMLH